MFFIYFPGVMGQGAVKPAAVQNFSGKFTTTFLFKIHLTSPDLPRHILTFDVKLNSMSIN